MGHYSATSKSNKKGLGRNASNVVSLFSHQHKRRQKPSIIRVCPEYDGIELLYANDRHLDKLFSLKVLCWALRDDDEVVAIVPWLKGAVMATELEDPLNGRWEGYRLPDSDWMFYDPPEHKVQELTAAERFFKGKDYQPQEIPDTIGTHAICSHDDFHTIGLMEVISWQLGQDGQLQAMVAQEDDITRTPVLPGDPCLQCVQQRDDFRYFFQHGLANKVKEQDPEALAALSILSAD